jgi:hypothetical protein
MRRKAAINVAQSAGVDGESADVRLNCAKFEALLGTRLRAWQDGIAALTA